MKYCITGGAGMIGSNLVSSMLKCGVSPSDIVVVDNFWRGKREYLEKDGELIIPEDNLVQVDLASEALPVSLLDSVEYLLHLADIVAGIGYVFNNEYGIFKQNNLINTRTFEFFSKSRVLKKIVYVGTACSFPQHLQRSLTSVLTEDMLFPAEPESAYGWSKLIGQLELRFLAKTLDAEVTTLMLHNVYGINTDFDTVRSQVIPSLINRIVDQEDGGEVVVWGTGKQGRAFVHVSDVCQALISSLETECPEYIQIGPSKCTSIKELVDMLVKISGKELRVSYDHTKPEGDLGRCADYSEAQNVLGWSPQTSLSEGLGELYGWVRNEKNK